MPQLLKALTQKVHFWYAGTFWNTQDGLVYQGHRVRVKVKVTGANTACLYVLFGL